MKFKTILFAIGIQLLFVSSLTFPQQLYGIDFDTVKAQQFDMGKMWTFENPPLDYFEKEYNFRPTEEWLNKVRKSALRFGNGCSASFVSEDGLIMTNHHCVRGILARISEEEEDLLNTGFFAKTIDEERVVPGLFVDQLVSIKDVTNEVLIAIEKGESDSAKIAIRDEITEKIKNDAVAEDSVLEFRVVSLYEGGKFSLYGYKRYSNISLVFVPAFGVENLGCVYDISTSRCLGLDCRSRCSPYH